MDVPAPGWFRDLRRRMRRMFVLKVAGVTAFTWLFFIGYFQLLRHPAHPVTVMPLTVVDALIPFQPQALVAYLSLWLYIGIAPGLLLSFRALVIYGLWMAAFCLAGLACFYFWPTEVPLRTAVESGFPGFALLKGVDAAGNACPSMHVAAAMYSAIWIAHLLRQIGAPAWLRAINVAWFCAIAYSTMAIKQHVALDALGGALLGIVFALPSLRWQSAGRR